MKIELWTPPVTPSVEEERVLKLVKRVRKLFGFLRRHRHEILDEAFQEELAEMYRDTGAGAAPHPPGQLCMALLIQGYLGISDAEAVQLTATDSRWQLVLDRLGATQSAFSQGALQQFRERLIDFDLDKRLLEQTVQVARRAKEFDWKKLPKSLRVGIDSRPLVTAGRVEDTFNLLGHAARKIAECAANMSGLSYEEICTRAHANVLLAPSVKAGLDIDWCNKEQKEVALETLVIQVRSLADWVARLLSGDLDVFTEFYVKALQQVQEQNLDEKDGRISMRQGVARDRRVSIEDPEARHGRKSKSKRFSGFKEHSATDLDNDVVLACTVLPANVPEEEAGTTLKADIEVQGFHIGELSIDRAYINSPIVDEIEDEGGDVLCKPWAIRNSRGTLSKKEFKIDMRSKTITCPSGEVESFEPGQTVEFDPEACGSCQLRANCTTSASGRGRTVNIAVNEKRQQRLRKLQATPRGRRKLRGRTRVEHRQAHLGARKGGRARYLGTRKNTFDLRRAGAIDNLHAALRAENARCAV